MIVEHIELPPPPYFDFYTWLPYRVLFLRQLFDKYLFDQGGSMNLWVADCPQFLETGMKIVVTNRICDENDFLLKNPPSSEEGLSKSCPFLYADSNESLLFR